MAKVNKSEFLSLFEQGECSINLPGFSAEIEMDNDPLNPRENSNLGTIALFEKPKEYLIGDTHGGEQYELVTGALADWLAKNNPAFNTLRATDDWQWSTSEQDQLKYILDNCEKLGCEIIPVWLYDHSGFSLSTKCICEWDSTQLGVIYITPDEMRYALNCKRISKRVRNTMQAKLMIELETYSNYLQGEVYCFNTIEDSVCGYYGADHTKSGLALHLWGHYFHGQ